MVFCANCSDFYLGDNICSRCREAAAREEAIAAEDARDETSHMTFDQAKHKPRKG